MTILNRLVRSGLSELDDYQEKRGVVLSNSLSLILTSAIVILYVSSLIFFDENLLDLLITGTILFSFPLLSNLFISRSLSKLFLCYVPVIFIWYSFFKPLLKPDTIQISIDGLRIYLLAVCFIPYLLFNRDKSSLLILGILPTFISFLFFGSLLAVMGFSAENLQIGSPNYQLMYLRTLITYIIISAGCFTFQSIITANDKFNQRLLLELKNQKEEIEEQNNKLTESQLRLNKMNQHLETLVEEKTSDIKRQNELLMNYAYRNAHHVRGPVARILGLIQISRIKTDLSNSWIFEKVECEANDVDDIVKSISKELSIKTPD